MTSATHTVFETAICLATQAVHQDKAKNYSEDPHNHSVTQQEFLEQMPKAWRHMCQMSNKGDSFREHISF